GGVARGRRGFERCWRWAANPASRALPREVGGRRPSSSRCGPFLPTRRHLTALVCHIDTCTAMKSKKQQPDAVYDLILTTLRCFRRWIVDPRVAWRPSLGK